MSDKHRNIELVDKRPFFEKALGFGLKSHILDQEKCRAMIEDAAKGTVQVAAFFGTSHLHTDLENARQRIVNLISLYLEQTYDGDLQKSAESLRDNTFLSHSRGGNDLLKALHALPDSTVFGDAKGQALKEFQDERTLNKPFSLNAYRKECKVRAECAAVLAAALWFADDLGLEHSALDFTGAETVIRSALLVRLGGGGEFPNRLGFAKLLAAIRSNAANSSAAGKLKIPKKLLDDVPPEYRDVAEKIRREIEKHDALTDPAVTLDSLLNLVELRYFVQEGSLEDVDGFDALVSQEWHKVTKGKEDPYSRLTIFMCIAAAAKPKTTVSETEARAMIRQVRQHGFDSEAVSTFIRSSAPFEIKDNLLSLWEDEFLPEAQEYLIDDDDPKYTRALKFLKENCNIKVKAAGKAQG
ncbi:hypothetical protein SAMN04515617_11521 [Collimonas sp. OK242]|uniref:hypothetical protein n=1 Tax=Collimonas sp. OK242 TaxID=1798195 RepID=UPI00089D200B|nr:hypothetical protein [Collimonas sp. OK242]SDY48307.1 hypothetical protein SAMN04515617_11521 [Collimonas sp. OK242]